MKFGYNRYRNRYDNEPRRSYRRHKYSDDESDSSSNYYSVNNDLLKEFINIKKSKEKIPNNLENKNSNYFIEEKSFTNNNFNENQNTNNYHFMEMEQPTQIFSALRKPNFN